MKRDAELKEELKLLEVKADEEYFSHHAHTEKELAYLERSAEICQELADLNRRYESECFLWRRKKIFYEEQIEEIGNVLHPRLQNDMPERRPVDFSGRVPDLSAKQTPKAPPKETPGEVKQKETQPQKQEQTKETAPAKDDSVNEKYASYAEQYGSPIPAKDYVSPHASKEVPPELIRSWYQNFPDHDLDDVVGMEDLKELAKKEILNKIGWERLEGIYDMPTLKSYLFFGPYGTGKTFFIESFAMELMKEGFRFLRLRGSDIHTKYVGGGEKVLKAAFNEAKDHAPCVLFFDELDEVCKDRGGKNAEGHDQRLTVEFIQEYDLLKTSDKTVVVLTASNYPDRIEGAMRSRIRTNYLVPLPEEVLRESYLRRKLKQFRLSDDISYEYMADLTDNFSMRDLDKATVFIKNCIIEEAKERFGVRNESGRILPEFDDAVDKAIQDGKIKVTKELFDQALLANPPEKKEDILASLKAFTEKK